MFMLNGFQQKKNLKPTSPNFAGNASRRPGSHVFSLIPGVAAHFKQQ